MDRAKGVSTTSSSPIDMEDETIDQLRLILGDALQESATLTRSLIAGVTMTVLHIVDCSVLIIVWTKLCGICTLKVHLWYGVQNIIN